MNLKELRSEIPGIDDRVYLNWGKSGPSPERVVDRVASAAEYHAYQAPRREGMYSYAYGSIDETREIIADFIGCRPDNVALTQSTADGIGKVASAIDWEPGDRVIRTDVEHSAGILPWRHVQDRAGIEIDIVEHGVDGEFDPADFAAAIGPDTKLVCLSAISWTHGVRLPVREVVDLAHEHGAYVLVDFVQSIGQTPVDVTDWNADFATAAGHKWLCGPWGAGVLYVADGLDDELNPAQIGYRSVKDPKADEGYEYHDGARRFEIGTMNPAPYHGLQESIAMVEEIGLAEIEDGIRDLMEYFKDGLNAEQLLSPRSYESGLVTVSVDSPEEFVDDVADQGIEVRTLPVPNAVRACFHAVNTREDADALRERL